MKRLNVVASLAMVWMVAGTVYAAGNNTANVNVTASVANNCIITASAMDFGAYDPVSANYSADLDATGSLTVRCTKGATPSSVTLGPGNNAGKGSYGTRAMVNGTFYLGYELFTDSGRTTVWNTTNTVQPTGNFGILPAEAVNLPIYGRVGKAQDVAAGGYSDVVLATINF